LQVEAFMFFPGVTALKSYALHRVREKFSGYA
jgi:hypothetical protein